MTEEKTVASDNLQKPEQAPSSAAPKTEGASAVTTSATPLTPPASPLKSTIGSLAGADKEASIEAGKMNPAKWLRETFWDGDSPKVGAFATTAIIGGAGYLGATALLGTSILTGLVGIASALGLAALFSEPLGKMLSNAFQAKPPQTTSEQAQEIVNGLNAKSTELANKLPNISSKLAFATSSVGISLSPEDAKDFQRATDIHTARMGQPLHLDLKPTTATPIEGHKFDTVEVEINGRRGKQLVASQTFQEPDGKITKYLSRPMSREEVEARFGEGKTLTAEQWSKLPEARFKQTMPAKFNPLTGKVEGFTGGAIATLDLVKGAQDGNLDKGRVAGDGAVILTSVLQWAKPASRMVPWAYAASTVVQGATNIAREDDPNYRWARAGQTASELLVGGTLYSSTAAYAGTLTGTGGALAAGFLPVTVAAGGAAVIGWEINEIIEANKQRDWEVNHRFDAVKIQDNPDRKTPPALMEYNHLSGVVSQLYNLDKAGYSDPKLNQLSKKYKAMMEEAGVVKQPNGKVDYSVFYYHPERLRNVIEERKKDIQELAKDAEKEIPKRYDRFGDERPVDEAIVEKALSKHGIGDAPHNSRRHLEQISEELDDLTQRIGKWHARHPEERARYNVIEFMSRPYNPKDEVQSQVQQLYDAHLSGQITDEQLLKVAEEFKAKFKFKNGSGQDVTLYDYLTKPEYGELKALTQIRGNLNTGNEQGKTVAMKVSAATIGSVIRDTLGGAVDVDSNSMPIATASAVSIRDRVLNQQNGIS